MKCNCTYLKLKERGYEPIDHAWSCPLNNGYYKKPSKRIMPPKEDNPYKEVNRFKQEYIKINRINEKKNKRSQSHL